MNDGYSSPLAEMLEKEKEEERIIEQMNHKKERLPHVKRLMMIRKYDEEQGKCVWCWLMENGKFYPKKGI